MVGYNKIKRALQLQDKGWNVYIYFLFCDGLFKWKVNEEQIACTMSACRRDRGKNEIKEHSYIPIRFLEFVTDELKSKEIPINGSR